jgi:hypothetical protein
MHAKVPISSDVRERNGDQVVRAVQGAGHGVRIAGHRLGQQVPGAGRHAAEPVLATAEQDRAADRPALRNAVGKEPDKYAIQKKRRHVSKCREETAPEKRW